VSRYQTGDIVARRKGLVMHKGLVMRDGRILHNTPLRGEHISTEEEFRAGRRLRVVRSTTKSVLSPESHLAGRGYHLFRNNCEHTVHRASTGRAHSPQLKAWMAGAGLAVVALALTRHPAAAVAGFAFGQRMLGRVKNR